jgi:hypothetical protein
MHLGLHVECENGRISSCILIYPTKGQLKWINKTAALAVGTTLLIHEELTRRTVTISQGAIQKKKKKKKKKNQKTKMLLKPRRNTLTQKRALRACLTGKLWRSVLACG